ncbi:Predicted arabinose efflux permease, MFS family [Octadecabacter temperatus]|uniref:Putative MFS-type transporter YcaD n=1 Tax=Octadecabacter temperatus TaxID=1458307 RepID=A0A0K0Y5U0_9RHOB|nr:MFS transporter [Octadecabacter temperatus]AKS46256.1 putative MFS-type transporter YcaD [Octadecabacter temperatus]SIO10660.1 Predicted arabinose efflux permease, MFS family [Octadecabacter temperatus]
MFKVFISSWALFLGMFMLMVGNGLQGTLLGVRGGIENFSTFEMSIVMSAYFVGFLGGSRLAPEMIRRVGHVRVFAALGSTISAVLILYPVLPEVWAWTMGRIVIGFCFSGVYVTAESWLNNSATNETRGQSLSIYMLAQMSGIVLAQGILSVGDVSGYTLFIIPSVLVSLAFAPILLSVVPTPSFETTRPMKIKDLVQTSPLASVGMFLLGGVFAAQFGMTAVYGTQAGLSVGQISLLVSLIYIAALVAQYPIGWVSDRMDRRTLIIGLAALGGAGAVLAAMSGGDFYIILIGAAIVGGTSNPLYALYIAYANDFLEHEDMAAASAGFIFINGVGAISGPILLGFVMGQFGEAAFWVVVAVLMSAMALYGVVRVLQRPSETSIDDQVSYTPVMANASPVAMELAQEIYIDAELDEQEAEEEPS